MKRSSWCSSAFAALLLALSASSAVALEESDRLWLVGDRAFGDGIYPVARRALERFVDQFPNDQRLADALMLLGKTRLALNDPGAALDAFRRLQAPSTSGSQGSGAQASSGAAGMALEARFWEAESLFRLKRYMEARAGYDEVLRTNAASPFAADALYGFGWSELELQRPEPAITAFRDFLSTWPDHRLAPSATYYLARALVDLKRYSEALPLLTSYGKYPNAPLAPDAQYLLGWTRVAAGDQRGGANDLRAFVAANPGHPLVPEARRVLNDTLAKYGDREELTETYAALMAQNPATPEALNDAALVAARLNRPRDQEAAWRKLRAEFPDHPLARRAALDLDNAAFKRKDWKEAASMGQAAAESEDATIRAEGWLLTGESELKLKRYSPAIKAFDAVTAVKGAEPSVRYRALAGLGLAHEEQKSWRPALAAYESVATKSPDATLRDWAKERAAAVKAQLNNAPPAPAPKSSTPAPPKKGS
ncbi:MAG TPA: tetratricopeptide repeat protein [Methylomirabilota bacterium]